MKCLSLVSSFSSPAVCGRYECVGPSGLAELEQLHVHVESNIERSRHLCDYYLQARGQASAATRIHMWREARCRYVFRVVMYDWLNLVPALFLCS